MSDFVNTEIYDFSNDASASSFGWNFQSNAGIFLFLKYINESKSIKIESKLQDIEIELKDGGKILAQAKSSQDYSIAKDKKEKFKDALISLAKYQNETNQMIYISNIPDMLKSAPNVFNNSVFSYESCLSETKEEIDDIFDSIGKSIENKISAETNSKKKSKLLRIQKNIIDLDKTKLYFSVIYPFFGDEQNRYKIIGDSIIEFLVDVIHLSRDDAVSIKQRLLDHWQLKFQHNSTEPDKGTQKAIRKEEFAWPIAVYLTEDSAVNIDDCLTFIPDKALKSEINRKLSSAEMLFHERFAFANVVIQDYISFKRQQSPGTKDIERLFVQKCGNNYCDEFSEDNPDEEICEYLTKLCVYRIITNYINMNKIGKGIGVTL
ncbi:MAG: hypothetical protein IKU15_09600 [Clostridia bacterium]|nr:hypothetical protein [Clostridia bacterium]